MDIIKLPSGQMIKPRLQGLEDGTLTETADLVKALTYLVAIGKFTKKKPKPVPVRMPARQRREYPEEYFDSLLSNVWDGM